MYERCTVFKVSEWVVSAEDVVNGLAPITWMKEKYLVGKTYKSVKRAKQSNSSGVGRRARARVRYWVARGALARKRIDEP